MSPAVAKTSQMWRATALVWPQRNRNLGHFGVKLRGLDYKFRRKLHSGAAEVHAVVHRARKSAHPAMTIAHARAKEQIQQRRQHRVPQIFVMPGHGSRLDLSAKAIAHHHFIALPPFFYESRDFAEIVTVVCVAHYDEGAMGRRNSRAQRRAVPSRLDAHDSGAQLPGNFDRAIGRTVVRYDYFASQPCGMKRVHGFRDANPY